MPISPTEVALTDLCKHYAALTAVDRLSLTIEPGEVLALLGPSGCGKTTTLRMIAGLVQPSAGEILVDRRPITAVPAHRRNIGMLFQNYALFPHLSVAGNVAFGLEMRNLKRAEIARRVTEALQLVQLDGYAKRMPEQLSGGQQQRVALARALIIQPAVLLLDEPFGALDKKLRETMQIELRLLQRRLGITTVIVTHDQDEALTLADRIAIMHNGRLEQVGSPTEIYREPVSRFVANFIGVSNFFSGRVAGRSEGIALIASDAGLRLTVRSAAADGGQVTVALRPEAIRIARVNGEADRSEAPNETVATLEQVVYRGFVTHYYLRLANGDPLVAFDQLGAAATALSPGDQVRARWSEDSNRVVHDGG